MQEIQLLKHREINKEKWDLLVDKFAKGLPYAYSWYLDAVCEEWNVIIYKDYEAGFAFQIKNKFGLPYSLHPFLVQQLGFFGNDISVFNKILSLIETKVFHYHYQLNHFNKIDNNLLSETKVNYELQLNKSSEDIKKLYKTNNKRNLKKAKANNISVTIEYKLRPTDIEFIQKYSKVDFDHTRFNQFLQLMKNANSENALEIYRAEIENELMAMVIFIKNKTRSVYLMAINNKAGQDKKANFLLVDSFITNNANSNIILDFEGSNIEGIARFYAGFGAVETNYQLIKKTSLNKAIQKII